MWLYKMYWLLIYSWLQ